MPIFNNINKCSSFYRCLILENVQISNCILSRVVESCNRSCCKFVGSWGVLIRYAFYIVMSSLIDDQIGLSSYVFCLHSVWLPYLFRCQFVFSNCYHLTFLSCKIIMAQVLTRNLNMNKINILGSGIKNYSITTFSVVKTFYLAGLDRIS